VTGPRSINHAGAPHDRRFLRNRQPSLNRGKGFTEAACRRAVAFVRMYQAMANESPICLAQVPHLPSILSPQRRSKTLTRTASVSKPWAFAASVWNLRGNFRGRRLAKARVHRVTLAGKRPCQLPTIVLSVRQRQELHKAMLGDLESAGLQAASAAFQAAAAPMRRSAFGLTGGDDSSLLEWRRTSILRLQKRVSDSEAQLSDLQSSRAAESVTVRVAARSSRPTSCLVTYRPH